jgi:hypothetical protein
VRHEPLQTIIIEHAPARRTCISASRIPFRGAAFRLFTMGSTAMRRYLSEQAPRRRRLPIRRASR